MLAIIIEGVYARKKKKKRGSNLWLPKYVGITV
jgi:hypothetical protein